MQKSQFELQFGRPLRIESKFKELNYSTVSGFLDKEHLKTSALTSSSFKSLLKVDENTQNNFESFK